MYKEMYRVKVKGTVPMLQNRFSGEPTPTRHIPQEECEKALYLDADGKPCIPAYHFESSMAKAAVNFKMVGKGKKTHKDAVRSAIYVKPSMIPIQKEWVIDEQAVMIGKARILRHRPKFDEWEVDFEIENRDERILPDTLKDILVEAGNYFGVGDGRPRYGLFEVLEFEKLDES